MLENVRPLTQEERESAREHAKRAVAGMQPRPEDFTRLQVQKYPAFMRHLITALCIAVLLFAFAISAIRLHHIAITTFQHSITDPASLTLVGWGFVFLAEIALVTSTLALAMVQSGRWMLYAVAFLATLIAVVGNVQLAKPHDEGGLFAWLEAISPPLIAIGMAQVLKTQMLHSIEARHAAAHAFEIADTQWRATLQNAEMHSEWSSKYANALKDALRSANKRSEKAKGAMAQLQRGDWFMLVQREMQADAWYTGAMQNDGERFVELQKQLQDAIAEKERLQNAVSRLQRADSSTGNHTGEIATLQDGALHNASCPHCDYAVEKATKRAASNALAAHLRGCKKRPAFSQNGKHHAVEAL